MTNALTRYLHAERISQEEFARRIGRTQATVSRYCSGTRAPDRDCAVIIERETGGAVPVASWSAGGQ